MPVPGGKNGKTFKAQTQSGLAVTPTFVPLTISDKEVQFSAIKNLVGEMDFSKQLTAVHKLGFDLMVKRARIGTQKHVRVRPTFSPWALSFQLTVTDDQITKDVLARILDVAGRMKGLGDWRPSSKTPGPYGRFSAEIE